MKGILWSLAAVGLVLGTGSHFAAAEPADQQQAAASQYTVYCASGHVGIDSRSAETMRSQWNACALSTPVASRGEAEKAAAEKFGGIGNLCVCQQ